MPDTKELQDFQEALAELLCSEKSHAEIMQSLREDSRFTPYREYVDQFDPDMVEVAQELMSKWARRKSE